MQKEHEENINSTSLKLSEQLSQVGYVDISKTEPTKLVSPDLQHVFAIDVSTDGQWIAAAGESDADTTNIVIYDSNLQQVKCLQSSQQYIYTIQFSPDCKRLLVGGHEPYQIESWNVGTWDDKKYYEGHKESIFRISFSNDSQYFCTSSHDMTSIIWKMDDPQNKRVLEGHTSYVYGCAISHNMKQIATIGFDQQLIVYNFEDGSLLHQFECHTEYASCVIFSNDDLKIITSGFDGKVKIWDSSTYELIKETQLHNPSSYIWSISLSKDDQFLFTAGCDNYIKVINLQEPEEQISYRNVMFGAPGSEICVKRLDQMVVASQYYGVLVWRK